MAAFALPRRLIAVALQTLLTRGRLHQVVLRAGVRIVAGDTTSRLEGRVRDLGARRSCHDLLMTDQAKSDRAVFLQAIEGTLMAGRALLEHRRVHDLLQKLGIAGAARGVTAGAGEGGEIR